MAFAVWSAISLKHKYLSENMVWHHRFLNNLFVRLGVDYTPRGAKLCGVRLNDEILAQIMNGSGFHFYKQLEVFLG